MQNKTDDQIVEEILTLDEISKKTLGSYIVKAANHSTQLGISAGEANKEGNKERMNWLYRKSHKRMRGIVKATKRLTKEQKETIESILEELELEEASVGDVVHISSHKFGVPLNKMGTFNVDHATKTHVHVIIDKEPHKFNVKTGRGIGNADHLMITKGLKENTIMESVSKFIDDLVAGNNVEAEDAFTEIMGEKIADRLETFRQEVAQGMFKESVELDEGEHVWEIEGGSAKGKDFDDKSVTAADHRSAMEYHSKEKRIADDAKRYSNGRHHHLKWRKHKEHAERIESENR